MVIDCKPRDVLQICETYPDQGYVGAFLLVEEVKAWGVQGFVHHVETRAKSGRIYLRIKWEHLEYIGTANLVPGDFDPEPSQDSNVGVENPEG